MKKLISVAAAALMVLGLTACTKTDAPDTPDAPTDNTVLKISGLDGGYGTAGWEAVAKAFEETHEGVTVELTLEKNIAEILRTSVISGKDIPDVIYLSVGAEGKFTDTMISEKQITDISDIMKMTVPGEDVTVDKKVLAGFTDGPTARPYEDGNLYLMPLNYGPCGLYYNAGLFAEKGWTVPTTWDEMWTLGDTAAAEGIALFTYPTTGYFDAFFSALLNATAGPEVFTQLMNYDPEAWNLPEVKQAFEIVGKLAGYVEENTVANANGEGFTKNQQLVLDNKALFIPNGNWLPGEMAEAPRAEGFEWGVTAIPSAGKGSYATNFTEQMYIPTGATNVDLAKEFLAFCYSDKAVELFYNNGGALLPIVGSSELIAETDQFMYDFLESANANTVGFAAAEAVEGVDLTSAEGILYGTVNSVVNGTKTVDEWHNAVVDAVTQIAAANEAAKG